MVGKASPYPDESAHLAQAAEHRLNEFSAGRDCARRALAGLGCAAQSIRSDADGLPLWPNATLGSISHSRGLCAAVAANTDAYTCLGLDIEKTNRLSDAAQRRVVHSDESGWVNSDQKRASLLFSAKEAFYKAQFPKWRSPGNFHDITLSIDESKHEARIQAMTVQFSEAIRERAGDFQFRYVFFADYVVTLCWLAS